MVTVITLMIIMVVIKLMVNDHQKDHKSHHAALHITTAIIQPKITYHNHNRTAKHYTSQ